MQTSLTVHKLMPDKKVQDSCKAYNYNRDNQKEENIQNVRKQCKRNQQHLSWTRLDDIQVHEVQWVQELLTLIQVAPLYHKGRQGPATLTAAHTLQLITLDFMLTDLGDQQLATSVVGRADPS